MDIKAGEDAYWFNIPYLWNGVPPTLWDRFKHLAPAASKRPRRRSERKGGRPRFDDRLVFSGLLWLLRTGQPWDELPEKFGSVRTVRRRLKRWSGSKVLEWLFRAYLDLAPEEEVRLWAAVFSSGRLRRSDHWRYELEWLYRYHDRAQHLALKYSKIAL
jgi:transposase